MHANFSTNVKTANKLLSQIKETAVFIVVLEVCRVHQSNRTKNAAKVNLVKQ